MELRHRGSARRTPPGHRSQSVSEPLVPSGPSDVLVTQCPPDPPPMRYQRHPHKQRSVGRHPQGLGGSTPTLTIQSSLCTLQGLDPLPPGIDQWPVYARTHLQNLPAAWNTSGPDSGSARHATAFLSLSLLSALQGAARHPAPPGPPNSAVPCHGHGCFSDTDELMRTAAFVPCRARR